MGNGKQGEKRLSIQLPNSKKDAAYTALAFTSTVVAIHTTCFNNLYFTHKVYLWVYIILRINRGCFLKQH
jgi:hypothetical protein